MPRGMGRRISSHGGAVVPAFTAMNECGQRKERERHSHTGIKEGEREREREREGEREQSKYCGKALLLPGWQTFKSVREAEIFRRCSFSLCKGPQGSHLNFTPLMYTLPYLHLNSSARKEGAERPLRTIIRATAAARRPFTCQQRHPSFFSSSPIFVGRRRSVYPSLCRVIQPDSSLGINTARPVFRVNL